MRTNLFAFTQPGSDYPGYISIDRSVPGEAAITLREKGHGGTRTVTLTVTNAVLDGLCAALVRDGLQRLVGGPEWP